MFISMYERENAQHIDKYILKKIVCLCIVLFYDTGFLQQYNWQPRYSLIIGESGVKHHNPHMYISIVANTRSENIAL
jgi:hypothetical protein